MALRGYWRFAMVALRAGKALSLATVLSTIVAAAAPLGGVTALGAVIGRVPAITRAGFDSAAGHSALAWAVAAGALFLIQWAAGALQAAGAAGLGDRVDYTLQRDLMESVMTPVGIAHLEDPQSLDLINVGRESFRSWLKPGRLAASLSGLAAGRLTLLGSCLILARFRWPLAAGMLSASLWANYEDKVASRAEAEHHYGGTELARRTEYYYELGVTSPAAKEVRVYGLPGFLLERYSRAWQQSMGNVFAKAGRRPLTSALVLGAVALLGLAWVCREAVAGRIGIGPAAVFAQAIAVGISGRTSWFGLQSELNLATLRRYDSALASLRAVTGREAADGLPPGDRPSREIRFEAVAFGYAGGDHEVLRDLDLVVPAGRSLAIVGANGAGKTTLVKLLCRLYEPTAGRITVDGLDLAEIDAVAWRRRIAAVFQDSAHYEMPARTNIGFGFVPSVDDFEGIRAAAADAGVSDTIDSLPRAWDTVLSSDYANGTDLSGGEWQKVGLARALFAVRHGAAVLVLDEPAAHLDARAEARLYERFLAMTQGLTTIVISHRFSTVRQASSIVVLKDGRVAEQGSHDALMARGGEYAAMFELQAARFADAPDEVGAES